MINDFFIKKIFNIYPNNLIMSPIYSKNLNKPGFKYIFESQKDITTDEINSSINYILEYL